MHQKILRTFWSLSIENLLRVFFGAFASIWLGRYLGPLAYGDFSYVLSFVLVFSPFTNLGLNEIVVSELVKGNSSQNELLGAGFYLKLGSGVVGVILCNAAAFFLDNSPTVRILILVYSVFFLLKSFDVIEYYYLSINRISRLAYYRTLAVFVSIIFKIIFILLKLHWSYFIYLSAIEISAYAIVYVIYYKIDGHEYRWKFSRKEVGRLLKLSYPVFFIIFFNMLQIRIDHLMISKMLGTLALGEYAVVVKIGEILNFIPLAISASLYPKLVSSLKTHGDDGKWSTLYFGSFFIVAVIMYLGLATLGGIGISILYGPRFELAPSIIGTYAIQLFFSYLFLAQTRYILAKERLWSFLPLAFLAVLLNFFLNLYFIKTIGIKGAVYASAISYALPSLVGVFYHRETQESLRYYFNVFSFIKALKSLKN